MRYLTLLLLLASTGPALADAEAMYLANAGLMVRSGETKVLFDPLFRNNFDTYQLLPLEMEQAIFDGAPPFDGVDAVFISHYHGDHFSPNDIVRLLREQPEIRLYAPRQASDELKHFLRESDGPLVDRITSLDLDYGDRALALPGDDIAVEAFHIPHSGWPERKPEVQNIAFRVTIGGTLTILHMGDADTRDEHFAIDGDRWAARQTHAAFPPYWFFTSESGNEVLEERLKPAMAIGVHVPVKLDPQYSQGLDQHDLFRKHGETRQISITD